MGSTTALPAWTVKRAKVSISLSCRVTSSIIRKVVLSCLGRNSTTPYPLACAWANTKCGFAARRSAVLWMPPERKVMLVPQNSTATLAPSHCRMANFPCAPKKVAMNHVAIRNLRYSFPVSNRMCKRQRLLQSLRSRIHGFTPTRLQRFEERRLI